MIEIESELIKLHRSLEKLESLDKYYYKKEDYNVKNNRALMTSKILNNDKLALFDSCSNKMYNYMIRGFYNYPIYDYLMDRVGMLDMVNAYRFRDSFRKKTERLKKRIELLFSLDNLFFITFTFDDQKLEKGLDGTSQIVLRKYVQRWLKKYCNNYVGNIDFGEKYGRLHFHALVSLKEKKVVHKTWSYGALNFKRVKVKNSSAISLYINKLCSHALKESTKFQYLLYPKK